MHGGEECLLCRVEGCLPIGSLYRTSMGDKLHRDSGVI